MVVINIGLVGKLKTKFQRKSIDREIDDAFSDSYSKKVLDTNNKYPQDKDQLSGDYRLEKQPEPSKSVVDSAIHEEDPFVVNEDAIIHDKMPEIDDPLQIPKGVNQSPPRTDDLLPLLKEQSVDQHHSSDVQRDEFFGQNPKVVGGVSAHPPEINSILLEMKDLRTQNEHIINLLKNIQDRLRGY